MSQNRRIYGIDIRRSFYIVDDLPIKFTPAESGGMNVLKYNAKTGEFEYGMEYFNQIFFGDGDVDHIDQDEFIQIVERRRAEDVKGEGELFDLYKKTSDIEKKAEEENRDLTEKEQSQIVELRKKTYEMFQKQFPDKLTP